MAEAPYLKPRFADVIGDTIGRIFAIYRRYPRRLLDLSALIVGASWLFGLLAGFIVAWMAWALQMLPGSFAEDFSFAIYFGMFDAQLGTAAGFMTMALGIFATRFWRDGEAMVMQRSLHQMITAVSHRSWAVFGVLCLVLVVVRLALFNPVFDLAGERDALFEGFGDDGAGPRRYRVLKWVNDLMAECASWLPVLLVVYLLTKEAGIAMNRDRWRAAIPAIGATVALVFVLDAVQWSLVDWLKRFLFPVIGIPFEASLIPYVFQVMLLIVLFALLLPASILVFTVPFESWAGPGHEASSAQEPGAGEP